MLPASYLAARLNTDTYKSTQVRFYKYGGSVWSPVPFQIDKRRKINLRHNLWNVTSALQRTDLCEYGYFPQLFPESGATDPFVSNQLQARDELVFLLNDAGTSGASSSDWPFSDDLGERYQIAIKDLRSNAL